MNLDELIKSSSIIENYIFANNPVYLYEHLKNDSQIINFAEDNNVKQLINMFNDLSSKKTEMHEDLLRAYIVLIAISMKDYGEVRPFFQNLLKNVDFYWVKNLAKIYLDSYRPIDLKIYKRPVIKKQAIEKIGGESPTQYENFKFSSSYPKIEE